MQLGCAYNTYYDWLILMILLLVIAGNFQKYIRGRHKELSGGSTLLIDINLYLTPRGKRMLLSIYQMCILWRQIPAHKRCHLSHLLSVGFKTYSSTLTLIKPMGLKEFHHKVILKSCSTEIAPILEVVFKRSLKIGELPSDWLTANICPIFTKGNHSTCPQVFKSQTNISNSILL